MPAKKADYEKIFNKLLGTDIKWSRLNLEELVELAVLFNHPETFLDRIGVPVLKERGRKRLVEAGIDILKEWSEKWEGPLARLVRRAISEEEAEGH